MVDLKEFRHINKLTQNQIADYLGVTQAFISQIERGGRPIPEEYINKIKADGLYELPSNINKDYLFTERLKLYIGYKGLSLNAFDQSIGTSNGYIGRAIKSNGSLGSEILQNIFSVYSDLNPTWLFTGEGDMLLTRNTCYGHEIAGKTSALSIDDERRTLINSINVMTETADRNSVTLAKIVDYLVSKDINVE